MTEKKDKTSPPKRSSKSSSLSVIVITVNCERLDYERAHKKIAGAGHIGKRR
jgi:hypothetical protein